MKIHVPSILRIKPNALLKIGKYLKQLGAEKICVFWGQGIQELFDTYVYDSCKLYNTKIFKEKVLENNEVHYLLDQALELGSSIDCIFAIGGGTIIDSAKYIAELNKIKLAIMPTVISNDAFCSPVSSLTFNNKKKSIKSKIADAIIIDTDIISKAPEKFMYSGIGDLLSKITSLGDWKLSFKETNEYVDDFSVAICQNALEAFLNYPNKDLKNLDYIQVLCDSLLMAGIAMESARSSRPASGSEHLISHAYDLISKKPSLHGIQVGVAMYAVSFLQNEYYNNHEKAKQALIKTNFLDFVEKGNKLNKLEFIEAIKIAPTIKKDFYTILSKPDSIEKLINFINNDTFISRLIE